ATAGPACRACRRQGRGGARRRRRPKAIAPPLSVAALLSRGCQVRMHRAGRAAVRSAHPARAPPMQASPFLAASTLALALSAGAAAAPARAAQAERYTDVATHAMPGMPGMGAMGRLAGAMGGQHASYGMTRHPGMPGRYMDVALHNRAAPGQPATQAIPK